MMRTCAISALALLLLVVLCSAHAASGSLLDNDDAQLFGESSASITSTGCLANTLDVTCPANTYISISQITLRLAVTADGCGSVQSSPSYCATTVDVTSKLAPFCNKQAGCWAKVSDFDKTDCAQYRVLQADFQCLAGSPNPPLFCTNPGSCNNQGTCVVDSYGNASCNCANGYSGDRCQNPPTGTCANFQCAANGLCKVVNGSPSCVCFYGYTGAKCDVPPPNSADTLLLKDVIAPLNDLTPLISSLQPTCQSYSCGQYGTCSIVNNAPKCTCTGGYTGAKCDIPPNASCTADYCGAWGTCSIVHYQPVCTCNSGYTGTKCDIPPNPCASYSCGQYGTCSVVHYQPVCTCNSGYTGAKCDIPPNPCASYSCGQYGTCSVVNYQPVCTCNSGYTGAKCDIPPNPCASYSCGPYGTCSVVHYLPTCVCTGGYSGVKCEIPPSLPTITHTGCPTSTLDVSCPANSYIAVKRIYLRLSVLADGCFNPQPPPTAPSYCATEIDVTAKLAPFCNKQAGCWAKVSDFDTSDCAKYRVLQADYTCPSGTANPPPFCTNAGGCNNQGDCVADSYGTISCACKNGWTGDRCQNAPPTDPCTNYSCGSYGNCVASNGQPTCVCNSGYTGAKCDIPPNPCASYSCGPYGTCNVVNYLPTCSCTGGYSGPKCDIPPSLPTITRTGCPANTLDATCPANSYISVKRIFLRLATSADGCGYVNSAPSYCATQVDVTAKLLPFCNKQAGCWAKVSDFDTSDCAQYRVLQADYVCPSGTPSPPPFCTNAGGCNNQGDCVADAYGVISCACKNGYSGDRCQNAPSADSPICKTDADCNSHGKCILGTSYVPVCACNYGFTGPTCATSTYGSNDPNASYPDLSSDNLFGPK